MILINNDSTLRTFLPNAFETIDDEVQLFDKLSPWLKESEEWLKENIVGDCISFVDVTSPLYSNMQSFVVADAFAKAIPSLDLVLTPNGFGIVSTNNIVPASKDRVERLIKSLITHKDRMICVIYHRLSSINEWHTTEQCNWLAKSLVRNYHIVLKDDCLDRWSKFLEIRERFAHWQTHIANEWISPELLTRLLHESVTRVSTKEAIDVIADLDSVVNEVLKYDTLNTEALLDIVHYIRTHSEKFPEWVGSDTAKLFAEDLFFRNTKNSAGYFF